MASVTLCLVALYGYRNPLSESVERGATRAGAILVGVLIGSLSSALVLPVTARNVATLRCSDALHRLVSERVDGGQGSELCMPTCS